MSRIAFLFPGQGAQKAGMGREFYESCEVSRRVYDKAGEWLGLDLCGLCFEPNDRLDLTEYTQAALAVTCLAMKAAVEERGLRPDVTAGLSLGEYCAIETAGGMSLKDAVTTVRKRGILMEQAVPAGEGGMAAVLGLDGEQVAQVTDRIEGVGVANYNCPGQIVITGTAAAVEAASGQLTEAGAKRVIPLKVSGPFHSPMLLEAGKKLAGVLEQVEFSPLRIPYVTNVTAEYVRDTSRTRQLLEKQISSSVLWQQSVERMLADGVDTFVEIGPGRTLSGFVKKISREASIYNIQTPEDMERVAAALVRK